MTKLSANEKLQERCRALAQVVQRVAPLYHAGDTTETQRQLIETMIGAAIWYLPQGKDLWTRQISAAAIAAYHPGSGIARPRLTADHEFPRKVAARELLTLNWSETQYPDDELLRRCRSHYGHFNYITPTENRN